MDLGLAGKRALVTGGSHGIGLATALALAREGCDVAICARTPETLDQARAQIQKAGVRALSFVADVLDPSAADQTVEQMVQEWGTVHVLVNNVGGGGRWGGESIEDTEDDVWADVYSKNAMAAVRFTRRVLPHMRRQHWGRIVTVGSILGREGGGRPWFNMAKAAEISLMKTLAMTRSLSQEGITFNTVAPGYIMIPGTGSERERDADPQAFQRWVGETLPRGRPGTADEVANVIAFLCSEEASLVNGATIAVDGGESHAF